MGNLRFAWNFLDYTATTNGGSGGEATNHPASQLEVYTWPQRTWRATDTGATKYPIFDFGSAKTPKAVVLRGANFPLCAIDLANDAAFTSGVVSLQSATAVSKDTRVNRRQAWFDFPSNATGRRYMRTIPSGTPDGGATAWDLGSVAAFDTVMELVDNPEWPLEYARIEEATRIRFKSGAEEVGSDGLPYLELVYGNGIWLKNGVQDQLFSIADVGYAPFVVWENMGDTSKVYFVRRIGPRLEVSEEFVTVQLKLQLREAA